MNINYIDKIDELIDKYPVEIVFDNIICNFSFAVLGSKPNAEHVPILQSNKNSNFKNATMPERWRDDGCYGQVTLWDLSDDEIKQIYLQLLSKSKKQIVKETGYKTTNKDIRILYQDAFCKCSVNTLTNETIFTTTITGEELTYNLSGHYYEPVLSFKNKDDKKSFTVHCGTWFPDRGLSAPNNEWKRFCYFAMADVINNEIKNQRLYELSESLYLYIEAVNIMFEETFFIGHNRVNSGIFPPAGGLIVNKYALNRQGEKIKEWDDYSKTNSQIAESILYEISKII